MFIFDCPKTNPKGQPITWSRILRDYLVLLAKRGRHREVALLQGVYAPLRGTLPSRSSALCGVYAPYLGVLLSCVNWLFKNLMLILKDVYFTPHLLRALHCLSA